MHFFTQIIPNFCNLKKMHKLRIITYILIYGAFSSKFYIINIVWFTVLLELRATSLNTGQHSCCTYAVKHSNVNDVESKQTINKAEFILVIGRQIIFYQKVELSINFKFQITYKLVSQKNSCQWPYNATNACLVYKQLDICWCLNFSP